MSTLAFESASEAGLVYVSDARPGIGRRRAGRGFAYVRPDGRALRDKATLRRIARIAIPPAWTDVWICPDPRGHIQATGRDARGRKQYRYHERFRAVRDDDKYGRVVRFGRALPLIRRRTAAALRSRGLSREKVVACVLTLLGSGLIRVGNEEYARANRSFGLTTLRARHVSVRGAAVSFRFRGKGGKEHEVRVVDDRLARVVRRCQDLPGQALFEYVDANGDIRVVGSQDVNDHLREIAGTAFSAKDFRTWVGTVLMARELAARPQPLRGTRGVRSRVNEAIRVVAAQLGNTPAVCRKSYVHPAVIDALESGALHRAMVGTRASPGRRGLSSEERAVLRILERSERGSAREAMPPRGRSEGRVARRAG